MPAPEPEAAPAPRSPRSQALLMTLSPPALVITCPSCPHRVEDHDAIGLRYCAATLQMTMTRGCVCKGAAVGAH